MQKENVEKFDTVAEEYNISRPDYSPKLMKFLEENLPLNEESCLLELGAGTGIATRQFYNQWKCNITALEPGEKMISKAKENCADFKKLILQKCYFEEFECSSKFDVIYSGTAFHWLNPNVKYEKASELLKPNGKLVLFWSYFRLHDTELRAKQQSIYEAGGLGGYRTNLVEYQETKMSQRRKEISTSNFFKIDHSETFTDTEWYTKDEYLALLSTYSDFYKVDENKATVLSNIGSLIDSVGGKVRLELVNQLELCSLL